MSECLHNTLLRIDSEVTVIGVDPAYIDGMIVHKVVMGGYTCHECGEIFNPPTIQEIEAVHPLPKRIMDPDGFSS
jgi:hypothetical protein